MNSNDINKDYACFYYCLNEKEATKISINYRARYAVIKRNCSIEECTNESGCILLSLNDVNIIMSGLHYSFFNIFDVGDLIEKDEEKERIKDFQLKTGRRIAEYNYYIDMEYKLSAAFAEKRLLYDELTKTHEDLIKKIDKSVYLEELRNLMPDEDIPEQERINKMSDIMKNGDNNGYNDFMKKLKSNPDYKKANEICALLPLALIELIKALNDWEEFFSDEYSLFTEEYRNKIDEYADKGLFLYCLNTPDLPLDDADIRLDDVYNYYLDNYAMSLRGTFSTFIENVFDNEINIREANDLVASFNLLNEGKYWAASRNLYSLIEHHHKLCSSLFNGYYEAKQKFKNGLERAEYIGGLFKKSKSEYYEKVWKKIDQAIKEINTGKSDRFVNRNAIVHGDYENMRINPNAKDVVNLFLLYVTMRQVIDYFANIENVVKEYYIFLVGYLSKNKKNNY